MRREKICTALSSISLNLVVFTSCKTTLRVQSKISALFMTKWSGAASIVLLFSSAVGAVNIAIGIRTIVIFFVQIATSVPKIAISSPQGNSSKQRLQMELIKTSKFQTILGKIFIEAMKSLKNSHLSFPDMWRLVNYRTSLARISSTLEKSKVNFILSVSLCCICVFQPLSIC